MRDLTRPVLPPMRHSHHLQPRANSRVTAFTHQKISGKAECMIQNFEQIREQLEKLAPTINAYKSEAVQLRIVELVFAQRPVAPVFSNPASKVTVPDDPPSVSADEKQRKPRKVVAKKAGRPGPGAMVDTLIEEGYFKAAKGVSEVVKYCRESKVEMYSNTEISVSLSRAVKAGKLKREKTADEQFTYSAP